MLCKVIKQPSKFAKIFLLALIIPVDVGVEYSLFKMTQKRGRGRGELGFFVFVSQYSAPAPRPQN